MALSERYRGLAEQARRTAQSADLLIHNGAYRSAAKVLGDAALMLEQAADEKAIALGVEPVSVARGQFEASVASLKDAAE